MTCLSCSRGTCLTGGKACLATAAGTLDQRLKCGRADPSLALGRGRPGVRGVPVTSTDDCDSDLNEDGIFTTRDALQTTTQSVGNCDVPILLCRRTRFVRGPTHNSSSAHSHPLCHEIPYDVRAYMMGPRQKRKQNARCAQATCLT